jgi:osmoprotectant transport system permease protein
VVSGLPCRPAGRAGVATLQHLGITAAAVVLGLLIALPLALLARRYGALESAVLGVSTGLYTIPSLALFPLLLPFTGLTATTVVIGLALYSLTILVRNILEGLRAVPEEVRESATGLGYSPVGCCCGSSCHSRFRC